MAAQKRKKKKKKCQQKFFAFWNAYYPNTHLIKALNSLDSSSPYGRLLEKQKTGGSRELFLPDFQTSSTKIFQKNIQILEAWKPTKDMKFRLNFFFTCLSTCELNII